MIFKYASVNNSTKRVINASTNPLKAAEGLTVIECNLESIEKLSYNFDTKKFFISDEELMKGIRIKRNELLSDSDYTQFTDSTHKGTKEEWKTYRQKLRDITKGVTDPDKIVFPEEPK